jgi:hypothetical protein
LQVFGVVVVLDDYRNPVQGPVVGTRSVLRDGVWVRLLDIKTALSARSYQPEGSVVIEVTDEFCPGTQAAGELVLRESSAQAKPLGYVAMWVRLGILGRIYLDAACTRATRSRANPRRHCAGGYSVSAGIAALALLYLVVGIHGTRGARFDVMSSFWWAVLVVIAGALLAFTFKGFPL